MSDYVEENVSDHAGHNTCCDGLNDLLGNTEDNRTKVCITGGMYGTHKEKQAYDAGSWRPLPLEVNYRDKKAFQIVMCPNCNAEYETQVPPIVRRLNATRLDSRYPGLSGLMILAGDLA